MNPHDDLCFLDIQSINVNTSESVPHTFRPAYYSQWRQDSGNAKSWDWDMYVITTSFFVLSVEENLCVWELGTQTTDSNV